MNSFYGWGWALKCMLNTGGKFMLEINNFYSDNLVYFYHTFYKMYLLCLMLFFLFNFRKELIEIKLQRESSQKLIQNLRSDIAIIDGTYYFSIKIQSLCTKPLVCLIFWLLVTSFSRDILPCYYNNGTYFALLL